MTKRLTIFLAVLVAVTLTTIPTFSAEDTSTTRVGWSIKPYLELRVDSTSATKIGQSVTNVVKMPEPTESDFARGFIQQVNAVNLTAVSNVDWEVQVEASRDIMGTSTSGGYEKPISDLLIKVTGGYQPVSTDPITIANGENGKHNMGVDYKILLDEEDYEPGNYKATLTYTIAVQ